VRLGSVIHLERVDVAVDIREAWLVLGQDALVAREVRLALHVAHVTDDLEDRPLAGRRRPESDGPGHALEERLQAGGRASQHFEPLQAVLFVHDLPLEPLERLPRTPESLGAFLSFSTSTCSAITSFSLLSASSSLSLALSGCRAFFAS
jgi:hypothetical protein